MRALQFLHQKYLWKPMSSPHPTVFILVQTFLITPWTITRASNWSRPWLFPLLQVILHSAAPVMFGELDFIVFLFYRKLLIDFLRLASKVHVPFVACETIHNLVPTGVSSLIFLHFLSPPVPTSTPTLKAKCHLKYLPCKMAVKTDWANGLPLWIAWLIQAGCCFLLLLCPKARCSYLF